MMSSATVAKAVLNTTPRTPDPIESDAAIASLADIGGPEEITRAEALAAEQLRQFDDAVMQYDLGKRSDIKRVADGDHRANDDHVRAAAFVRDASLYLGKAVRYQRRAARLKAALDLPPGPEPVDVPTAIHTALVGVETVGPIDLERLVAVFKNAVNYRLAAVRAQYAELVAEGSTSYGQPQDRWLATATPIIREMDELETLANALAADAERRANAKVGLLERAVENAGGLKEVASGIIRLRKLNGQYYTSDSLYSTLLDFQGRLAYVVGELATLRGDKGKLVDELKASQAEYTGRIREVEAAIDDRQRASATELVQGMLSADEDDRVKLEAMVLSRPSAFHEGKRLATELRSALIESTSLFVIQELVNESTDE